MRRMLDSSEIPWKAGLRKVSRVSSRGVRTEIPGLETGDPAPAPAQHLLCIVCGTVALLAYSPYSGYSALGGFTFWQKCEFYKVLLICSAYNLSIDGNKN